MSYVRANGIEEGEEVQVKFAKSTDFILAMIPLIPVFITSDTKEGFVTFQTFSLDAGAQLLITTPLLDRFLACMKPASITLRPPCAGVFLGLFTRYSYRFTPSAAGGTRSRAFPTFIRHSCRCRIPMRPTIFV